MESTRLYYRPFTAEDAADLYEYFSDPEVVLYEPYDPMTMEQAQAEAARRASDPRFWAVCLKETDKMIGNIYLAQQEPKAFDTWEIGYVFGRSYQGKATRPRRRRRCWHMPSRRCMPIA